MKTGRVERIAVTATVLTICLLVAIITARLLWALAGWFFGTTGATGLCVAGIVLAGVVSLVTRERAR